MGVASDGGRNSGWRRHVLHRPPSRRSGVAYRLTVPCLMGNAGADLQKAGNAQLPPEGGGPETTHPRPHRLLSKVAMTCRSRGTLGKTCHFPQPQFPSLQEDSS